MRVSEQILVRHLPDGTKAMLGRRARRAGHSVEAEVREILARALADRSPEGDSITSFLTMPGGEDIEFEPEGLGLRAREVEL